MGLGIFLEVIEIREVVYLIDVFIFKIVLYFCIGIVEVEKFVGFLFQQFDLDFVFQIVRVEIIIKE